MFEDKFKDIAREDTQGLIKKDFLLNNDRIKIISDNIRVTIDHNEVHYITIKVNPNDELKLKHQILDDVRKSHQFDGIINKYNSRFRLIEKLTHENEELKEISGKLLADLHIANEQLTTKQIKDEENPLQKLEQIEK